MVWFQTIARRVLIGLKKEKRGKRTAKHTLSLALNASLRKKRLDPHQDGRLKTNFPSFYVTYVYTYQMNGTKQRLKGKIGVKTNLQAAWLELGHQYPHFLTGSTVKMSLHRCIIIRYIWYLGSFRQKRSLICPFSTIVCFGLGFFSMCFFSMKVCTF